MAECYEFEGVKHSRYHHAVSHILSERSAIAVSVFQITNVVLLCISYTITGTNEAACSPSV